MAKQFNIFAMFVMFGLLIHLCALQLSQAKLASPALVPHPQQLLVQQTFFTLNPTEFKFIAKTSGKCPLLDEAINRYQKLCFISDCSLLSNVHTVDTPDTLSNKFNNDDPLYRGNITSVTIEIRQQCGEKEWPQLNMDEMYTIRIDTEDFPKQAFIFSNKIWGAIRALETFSQLIQRQNGIFTLNSTFVIDFPRFSHRGLLVDTSRHFLPMHVLLENLDAMAYNKLNVLHWHIVDDPSFPYVSEQFPELSSKGSYNSKNMIYSASDIQNVLEYARVRGIRVIMEFDSPGHTLSWGKGIPSLLTPCYNSSGQPDGTYGPIDPTLDSTYEFLEKFFQEIVAKFPDQYIHIGGDEVDYSCWKSNPNIVAFMRRKGIVDEFNKLEEYYVNKLIEIVARLKKSQIVWQEVFDNNVSMPSDTVVNVWKDGYEEELYNVTEQGFTVILSSCWYLNYISYGYDWYESYDCDPQSFNGSETQNRLVVGGQVSMWGEWVDGTNFIARTWPRATAVAERLWSAKDRRNHTEAQFRMVPNRCRLLERGLRVQPIVEPKEFDFGYCDCDSFV